MPTGPLRTTTSTLDIYIKLAQYPILADRIRTRMRQELFRRGIISEEEFEAEVKNMAIESQKREGVYVPLMQEPASIWQIRLDRVRDYHTDFYFGYNLPNDLFEQIVVEELQGQPAEPDNADLTFNPELAPWSLLFQQGEIYESLPPHEQESIKHHLEEIKVVLIKGMISDQLPFVGIARTVFSIADLRRVFRRRIGTGKIGGKAAGMLLAWKILQQRDPISGPDISTYVEIPESYFVATDVLYEFRHINGLDHYMNEKYRGLEDIRRDFPTVIESHLQGRFPERIVDQLRAVLDSMESNPIIVRSSSLLEDNFGYSFAGKYQSYFCPNQGTPSENLRDLLNGIRRIYASTGNPDAILYRQKHGLIDFDERMAILIQKVRGQPRGRYFFPTLAGVGFSQNPFPWNPKIRREEGFLRLVWGIGTRAVDRVDKDYPRMLALSHPTLRPETTARDIRLYSQRFVDAIDMEENKFVTLPAENFLKSNYPELRYIASLDKGDYLQGILSMGSNEDDQYVLTFDYLTKDRKFVKLMRTTLARLAKAYKTPVDIEFTVEIVPDYPHPDYKLHILQCRPLSLRQEGGEVIIPQDLPEADVLFTSSYLIPNGAVEGIRYIIFIDPRLYRTIPDNTTKLELGRIVSRLNKKLEDESFILMGPGRWGSQNIDLGVRVTYADIYNTKVLIEMAVIQEDGVPELSYGTHFFQDLVEGGIHSLPLHLDNPENKFNWPFFTDSTNALARLLPDDDALSDYVRVIDVPAAAKGRRLTIMMDGAKDEAVGFLQAGTWENGDTLGSISSF